MEAGIVLDTIRVELGVCTFDCLYLGFRLIMNYTVLCDNRRNERERETTIARTVRQLKRRFVTNYLDVLPLHRSPPSTDRVINTTQQLSATFGAYDCEVVGAKTASGRRPLKTPARGPAARRTSCFSRVLNSMIYANTDEHLL
ncbi:hypothetical protein EVAR_33447_1 [Eumeta japonica]|uniref:Uncharacterized protein n=1 Tax=Eumeta variegata TaxID=151549 RepID=A0A4C1W141_EUMVA|nr:hypothetical protein EVAR_33447_1 [Eumeta japonica]